MAFPIKKGSQGEPVIQVQGWLNLAAILQKKNIKLKTDGDFGASTEKALRELVGVTEVTESTGKAMAQALPAMKIRYEDVKAGRSTPDMALRSMIAQDQIIFQKLLEVYAIYEKSSADTRQKYKAEFARAFDIAARLMNRMKKLEASKQAIVFTKGYPKEYTPLVQRYVKSAGVGVVPLVVIGVVALAAIIVGGAATYGIISWLTPAYSESTVDFKQTTEIKRILEQLPASDKATLIADVERQIDKAYVTGKRDGKLGGFFGGAKTVIVVSACVAGYFFIIEPAMDNRKARRATA